MCLYFLQTFNDGASVLRKCSVDQLQSILNPDEAKRNRLIVSSYKNAVHDFCNESQSGDKIMIVAFDKDSSDPSGLILLKKNSYDAHKLTSLAGRGVPSDMRATARKLMWEVTYCVRRVDKRSLCLGDILLSCAIEEVRNRARQDSHGASTYLWLVLAGGFSNLPALRLYLAHGFKIIGFYEAESEVLMAVRNIGDDSTRRALKQVTSKLESTFLLPVLKGTVTEEPLITWMAPDDMFASSSSQNIPDSQGTVVSGVNLFSQCSVDEGKVTPGSELQGSSMTDQLEIQRASSRETQEDQSCHLRVSDDVAFSEQTSGSELQGTSKSNQPQIQRVCSHDTQDDQVSEEEPFSEQSPVGTEVEEDTLEQDELEEVSK